MFDTLDALLDEQPQFVVTSVPRALSGRLLVELASKNMPLLAETPPAADLAALNRMWKDLPTSDLAVSAGTAGTFGRAGTTTSGFASSPGLTRSGSALRSCARIPGFSSANFPGKRLFRILRRPCWRQAAHPDLQPQIPGLLLPAS